MPKKKFQKSLQSYFSKFKIHTSHVHIPAKSITTSTNWVFSGCKHPKTPSFAIDQKTTQEKSCHAATLSDIDRFLIENFSSLYCDEDKKKKKEEEYNNDDRSNIVLFESPRLNDSIPQIQSTNRFFTSPVTSSSLLEEAQVNARASSSTSTSIGTSTGTHCMEPVRTSKEIKGVALPDESIAVLTYSPDPYNDFRRSMEEMIEARFNQNQSIDWDFMEELLFCYLNLNDKKSYRYILGAFVDLTSMLRQNNDNSPIRDQQSPSRRERRKKKNGM